MSPIPAPPASYLIFALCLAFAAPLARLAQVESSCVNFWGASDEDVRSVEAMAATVFGRGTGDGGYSRSWQETTAGVMQMADGHCGLPLVLSDLNGLGANSKIAVQKAADIAYSITDGSTLRRLARRDGQGAEAAHRAQVLVVSASPRRLSGSPRIHNTLRSQQAEARIIDIPIPNRSTGIFDRSLSRPDREGRKLAERLRNSSLAHYGTAGRAFIERLVRAVGEDEVKFKVRLDRRMNQFLEKAGVDTGDVYEVQFARRFALAYAAGTLAIEYKLAPWHRDLVKRSIRRCYWRAHERRTGPQEAIRAAADAVICRLQRTDDIADLRGITRPIDLKFAERAKALLLPHDEGSLLAIRPEVFRSWVGATASAQHVAAELERRGQLIPRSNGRRTRQVRVPGLGGRRDYYCLKGDVVDLDW
jgi:hypothetical protein